MWVCICGGGGWKDRGRGGQSGHVGLEGWEELYRARDRDERDGCWEG